MALLRDSYEFIREAYEKDRIKGAHTIFTHSYSACWDAAILAVPKVLDKHKESLNLNYLLNCIEAAANDYPLLTKEELLKQVNDHRAEIRNLEARIPGIWDERDRIVAHLDRKHVNNPVSVRFHPPIKLDDLHSAIITLRRILMTYNSQLEANGISIDENQIIWDDLEELIKLLNEDSK